MKIFVDTNVVLDTCLPARPGRQMSEAVLSMENPAETRIYMSSLTVANAAYFLRKHEGKAHASNVISRLFKDHFVLPVNDMNVYEALRSDCPDFEDALQFSCADYGNCDCIITKNVTDFRGHSPLPVFTPEEFLAGCRAAAAKAREKK